MGRKLDIKNEIEILQKQKLEAENIVSRYKTTIEYCEYNIKKLEEELKTLNNNEL